jgi:hypothetical protein
MILMLAGDERLAAEPQDRFGRAWLGLAVASLLWGIVLANVWGISWMVFRDPDFLVMPAAITLALYCLLPFKRAVVALGRQLGGQSADGHTVAVAVVVVVLAMSFMRLSPDWARWEFPRLPWWIEWLRPQAKLYRVLLLMPAWGTWAMLITLKFCRPGQRTEPQLAAMARGCDAVVVAIIMAVLLAVSIFYFHYLGLGGQVLVPLATIVAAIAGGVGFCHVWGGLTRQGLLATNLATQIVFVMAYLVGSVLAHG